MNYHHVHVVDIVAVERQARAMQAQYVGEAMRSGWRRLAAWLRGNPAGQTA